MTAVEDKIMAKSLIETYKTLKEAGGASGGFVQAMQKKAAGSGAAQAAPVKPAASVPTQTSGPNRPPPGGFISPQAAMKAGQNFNVGSTGGVVSRPAAPGKTPTLDRTIPKSPVYPNKGMAGSPLDQTQGARSEVGRDYRLNKERQLSKTSQNSSLEKSYNAAQNQNNKIKGTPPVGRDASLDSPNEKSPMARATNPNIGGAGGGNYKAAQTPSVTATGNPNAAGGTAPVKPGTPPKPTPKPATTASQTQTKKPGVVQKPNVIVKPAGKSQSAGTQNNMTPAQRAQQNRQVERGNSNKKLIGLGVKTGKVTRNAANSKRPIGSSQLKEGVMNNKQLAEIVKQIREKKLLEIIGKPGPFDPVHPEGKQDSGSPNQYAHRKKSVAEAHGPLVKGGQQGKGYLGGKALVKRSEGQKMRGNQNVYGRNTITMGEQDEEDLGPTETGQTGKKTEKVTVNPKDTTFSARNSTNIKEIKEK
jgi:hypothetical protein